MKKIWKFLKENKLNIFIILVSVIIGTILSIFRSDRRFESIKNEYGRSKRDEGYKDGYNKGYTHGEKFSKSYNKGYSDGRDEGYIQGSKDTKNRIYNKLTSKYYNKGYMDAVKTIFKPSRNP